MTALGIVARIALSGATLLFLASIGGGMLVAAPILVLRQRLPVRRSGPVDTVRRPTWT